MAVQEYRRKKSRPPRRTRHILTDESPDSPTPPVSLSKHLRTDTPASLANNETAHSLTKAINQLFLFSAFDSWHRRLLPPSILLHLPGRPGDACPFVKFLSSVLDATDATFPPAMSEAYERERQNNSRLDELSAKVSTLRGVTIDIYDNARAQEVIDSTVRPVPSPPPLPPPNSPLSMLTLTLTRCS